jgi:hypothetical protein
MNTREGEFAAIVYKNNKAFTKINDCVFKIELDLDKLYEMVPDGSEHIEWHNKFENFYYLLGIIKELSK